MNNVTTLLSKDDASVNFVFGRGFEARYVQRDPSYFICYLSSHTGCNKACRFCHLTQTGQTDFEAAKLEDYIHQARLVMSHYDTLVADGMASAGLVNFNLMARGEPLSNKVVTEQTGALLDALRPMAAERGLKFKLNISSIYPLDFDLSGLDGMIQAGQQGEVVLFYSLYSLNEAFRKRWIPKSHKPSDVLSALANAQSTSGVDVVLHWAYIANENDSEADVRSIAQAVEASGLRTRFNLVRYNPYSSAQGIESSDETIESNFRIMSSAMSAPGSRIVPRVGFDVKASCGMFVEASSIPC